MGGNEVLMRALLFTEIFMTMLLFLLQVGTLLIMELLTDVATVERSAVKAMRVDIV